MGVLEGEIGLQAITIRSPSPFWIAVEEGEQSRKEKEERRKERIVQSGAGANELQRNHLDKTTTKLTS